MDYRDIHKWLQFKGFNPIDHNFLYKKCLVGDLNIISGSHQRLVLNSVGTDCYIYTVLLKDNTIIYHCSITGSIRESFWNVNFEEISEFYYDKIGRRLK